MILREATIKYSDRDPDLLSKGSGKRICVSCDGCGRVRWIIYYSYNKAKNPGFCKSCLSKGKNNPMYGVHRFGKLSPSYGKNTKITLTCKHCNENFKVFPVRKDQKFCSEKCYGKWETENRIGKLAPNWQGGITGNRDHILPIKECNCLNKRFPESSGHHLNKDTIIFIPIKLHRHLYHNMKSGQGMYEMNMLALQFINGEY